MTWFFHASTAHTLTHRALSHDVIMLMISGCWLQPALRARKKKYTIKDLRMLYTDLRTIVHEIEQSGNNSNNKSSSRRSKQTNLCDLCADSMKRNKRAKSSIRFAIFCSAVHRTIRLGNWVESISHCWTMICWNLYDGWKETRDM